MMNVIKNNVGKFAVGSVSSAIAIIGAMFALDARYAHAIDVEKEKVHIQRVIADTTSTYRKQIIEDKLFELDVKQAQARDPKLSLSPADSAKWQALTDAAMRDRYERQLKDIAQSHSAIILIDRK